MYGARYGGYGVLYGAHIIKIGEVLDAGVSQILHHLGVKRKTSFHYLGMGPGNVLLQVEPSSLSFSLSHTPQNRALFFLFFLFFFFFFFFSPKTHAKNAPFTPVYFLPRKGENPPSSFLSFYTY